MGKAVKKITSELWGNDWEILSKYAGLVVRRFPEPHYLEIGTRNGGTTLRIAKILEKAISGYLCVGIDIKHEPLWPDDIHFKFIKGDSHDTEVIKRVKGYAPYHLIFVDACHCKSCVLRDAQIYSNLLAVTGYIAFHDANRGLVGAWVGYREAPPHVRKYGIQVAPALDAWIDFRFVKVHSALSHPSGDPRHGGGLEIYMKVTEDVENYPNQFH